MLPRFDAILDIDNIRYVIHPKTGRKVWLTPAEATAKFRYLAGGRLRLKSLISAAVFDASNLDADSQAVTTPTGQIGDQQPHYYRGRDNSKNYVPSTGIPLDNIPESC